MIKGIHHIGASVQNLETALAFYQGAVDLPSFRSDKTSTDTAMDRIMGLPNVRGRDAFLGANTAYLELTEFDSPQPKPQQIMPVYGPGITHVCFQSPAADPAFDKFRR